MSLDVVTSTSCRDITSWLRSFRLMSSCCHDLSIKSLPASTGCSWCRDITLWLFRFHLLVPDVTTSISCRDLSLCCDITMLSRHRSFRLWLILSRLSCDSCRDLHQIPLIFLVSRPQNLTVHTPNCINESASCFRFCSTIRLYFSSTYCCIFLLSFSLPANNKLVSFFIFLYINYSFLIENQT